MDRFSELEQLWNEKIALLENQAKIQMQAYNTRINTRTEDKARLIVLQDHIGTLKSRIDSNRRYLAGTETLPNFHQLQKEYQKSKGEENRLEIEKKTKNLTILVDRFRQALVDLDIESAQALFEQLELNECSTLKELKNELIEAIKKL